MKTKTTSLSRKLLTFFIAIIVTFSFSIERVNATHMAGADLTYQYLGNNQYLITYTFYRDCIGIDAQTSIFLNYGSASCGLFSSATLLPTPGTGQQITQVCPGTLTTCDGGTATGIQEWEYTGIVTLNAQCPDWNFSATECCRNAAITTLVNPDSYNMYIEANLNNMLSPNNSPIFSNIPIAFECIGQNNYYNHGGLDVDGDSLVYSFITPRDAQNTDVTYDGGYSLTNPLSSSPAISIDPVSGDVFMHPTASEVAVIAVRIEEYRNGILIGTVMRDIQVYTIACSNNLPLASGINGTTDFTMNVCLNGQICFDVLSSDVDNPDSLTVTWNNGIPDGTFTVDSTLQHPIGHFCWTPDSTDVRTLPYIFTVTVRDNACPTNGVQSFSYAIFLSSLNATTTSRNVTCNGGHNGSAGISIGVPGIYEYIWTPGEFTTPNVTHLTAGTYTVMAADASGCNLSYTFEITEPPAIDVVLTTVDASCSGAAGSATAIVSGGVTPYTYSWNTTPPSSGSSISGLNPDDYILTVTDSNHCSNETPFTINVGSGFTANMVTTPATCSAADGSATVSTSGGSGDFDFQWSPAVSTDSIATGLTAGSYNVTITDNVSGCAVSLSGIVNNSAGIVGTLVSSSNATCENGEDGTAEVVGSGGTAPYFYEWQPGGATTALVNNLSPGTYVVEVSDYNGCPDYVTVTIGYDFPLPVVDLGNDTVICFGSSITLQAGAGFASYLWSDNSTLSELTVSNEGVYSVLVTDLNGCENFDAIMVDTINCQFGRNTVSGIASHGVYLFPNPSSNEISIVTDFNREKESAIRIYNSLGQMVHSTLKNANTDIKSIDISSFESGLYMVQISTDAESHSLTFIKR
ncbi:MAG: T9SS type A sorting domain-containing protein [Bacteroidetes bacterium]|nr:T9SS type A sorting domain-containing protein [Bacteroidota bacterium]